MKRPVLSTSRYSRGRIQGFTLVEIILVVVVLGILAAVGTFGFSALQRESRNAQRASDILALTEALEKYHSQYGEYPACEDLNDDPETVAEDVLTGLESEALRTPLETDTGSSVICTDLVVGQDAYAYIGDESSACEANIACYSWVLRYQREGGDVIEITSKHAYEVFAFSRAQLEAFCSGAPAPSGYNAITAGALTYGTPGNDIIMGTGGVNEIYGGAGDDIICGLGSGDALYGEDGTDYINGGLGGDEIAGGNGPDLLDGSDGTDDISGDVGDDILYGGITGDALYGGDGNDQLFAEAGADAAFGGNDNDIVDGGDGSDEVDGGFGDDTLYGGIGADALNGGAGYDRGNDDGGGSMIGIEEIF